MRKTCKSCNRGFEASGRRVYCSEACSIRALKEAQRSWNERRRREALRARESATCKICGKPIPRTETGRPLAYCSDSCRSRGLLDSVTRQRRRREERKIARITSAE